MPPTSAPAAAVAADPSSVSALSFDLEDMTTADLLNNINPELLDYVKCNTPHVYSGLIAQERTNGAAPNDPSNHPTGPTLYPIEPIMPVPSPPPSVNYPHLQSPSSSHALSLANSVRNASRGQSVSVTSLGTNPTNSPSVPLLSPHSVMHSPAPPLAMSMPPHLTNPSLAMQNPTLMAVLRQAQAMASVPHLQPGVASRCNFPPGTTTFNSPLQRPNNATVAAVAGAAAAAAAAAAANCSAPQRVHRRFAPSPLQNNRLPQRAHPRTRVQLPCNQKRVPSAQASYVSKSTQLPSKTRAMTSTPVQPQPPLPTPTTMRGQKRPNAAMKHAAATTSTVVNSSCSGKRPSSLSSRSSQSLTNASAPASRSRLHPAVGALAGVDASVSGRANSAASSGAVAVSPSMERIEKAAAQSSLSGQTSDADDDADVEVKKAMRAERNRQSAAASRERKKQYIKELERRVDMLSEENAKMQVSQFRLVRERLDHESKILDEVKQLKRKVVDRDMEIHKLSRELQNAKLKGGDRDEGPGVPRPKTWDETDWGNRNRGSRRRM
ncbi:unnamed protein product [Agarophyton chilense]